MYPQAMKITMTRLEHGQQGLTFFKDEPGQAPIVELHNVPAAWTSYGTLNIKISLILNEDKDTACGYKTVRGEKGDARGGSADRAHILLSTPDDIMQCIPPNYFINGIQNIIDLQ